MLFLTRRLSLSQPGKKRGVLDDWSDEEEEGGGSQLEEGEEPGLESDDFRGVKASDEMVVSCAAKAGGKVKGFAFVKGLEKGGGCRLVFNSNPI